MPLWWPSPKIFVAMKPHNSTKLAMLQRQRINAEVRWRNDKVGGNSVVLKIWTRSRPPALYSPHKVLIFRILLEHYSVVQQEICDLRPFTVYTALIWNCQICARWLQWTWMRLDIFIHRFSFNGRSYLIFVVFNEGWSLIFQSPDSFYTSKC